MIVAWENADIGRSERLELVVFLVLCPVDEVDTPVAVVRGERGHVPQDVVFPPFATKARSVVWKRRCGCNRRVFSF